MALCYITEKTLIRDLPKIIGTTVGYIIMSGNAPSYSKGILLLIGYNDTSDTYDIKILLTDDNTLKTGMLYGTNKSGNTLVKDLSWIDIISG